MIPSKSTAPNPVLPPRNYATASVSRRKYFSRKYAPFGNTTLSSATFSGCSRDTAAVPSSAASSDIACGSSRSPLRASRAPHDHRG